MVFNCDYPDCSEKRQMSVNAVEVGRYDETEIDKGRDHPWKVRLVYEWRNPMWPGLLIVRICIYWIDDCLMYMCLCTAEEPVRQLLYNAREAGVRRLLLSHPR